MTDYLVVAAIAAGIAIGILVCGFLGVLILYSWSMLVSYLADKCDASINKYRDKLSRNRSDDLSDDLSSYKGPWKSSHITWATPQPDNYQYCSGPCDTCQKSDWCIFSRTVKTSDNKEQKDD